MQNEWIDVNLRKPPNDYYVLVAKWDHRPRVCMHFIMIAARVGDGWVDDKDGELLNPKYGYITHWMPLPDGPKTEILSASDLPI